MQKCQYVAIGRLACSLSAKTCFWKTGSLVIPVSSGASNGLAGIGLGSSNLQAGRKAGSIQEVIWADFGNRS